MPRLWSKKERKKEMNIYAFVIFKSIMDASKNDNR